MTLTTTLILLLCLIIQHFLSKNLGKMYIKDEITSIVKLCNESDSEFIKHRIEIGDFKDEKDYKMNKFIDLITNRYSDIKTNF